MANRNMSIGWTDYYIYELRSDQMRRDISKLKYLRDRRGGFEISSSNRQNNQFFKSFQSRLGQSVVTDDPDKNATHSTPFVVI